MTNRKPGDFLNSIKSTGIRPGLETIARLLEELDNPQDFLKCIHIAGTNGKGSLSMFLTSVFNQAGIKSARFNTPAVFKINEMFSVSGVSISDEAFIRIEEIVRKAAEHVQEKCGLTPTEFECETAMAFYWFKEQAVDIVLLECGMGGLLDATNIIRTNICSVITSISLEHMAYLGSSIEEIAEMKSGIIKPSSPVFIPDSLQEEAIRIVKKNAFFNNSYVFYVKKYTEIPMKALYQYQNAGLAIDICYYLNSLGYRIAEENMKDGIRDAYIPGRFEFLSEDPAVVIDGAHNPEAVAALMESLENNFPGQKLLFIYGAFQDKDIKKILEIIAPAVKELYCVRVPSKRAEDPALIAEIAHETGINAKVMEEPEAALDTCLASKTGNPVICFGSLSYLYQIKECMTND